MRQIEGGNGDSMYLEITCVFYIFISVLFAGGFFFP